MLSPPKTFYNLTFKYNSYYMPSEPDTTLETFPNPAPERDYAIRFDIPEFTCLCPLTGQPDFAHLYIEYIPDALCVELKSLKNYFWSYRDQSAFHEAVSNQILTDLCNLLKPRYMQLRAEFNVRGGIATAVTVTYPDNADDADAIATQDGRA